MEVILIMIPVIMIVLGLAMASGDSDDPQVFLAGKIAGLLLMAAGVAIVRAMIPPQDR